MRFSVIQRFYPRHRNIFKFCAIGKYISVQIFHANGEYSFGNALTGKNSPLYVSYGFIVIHGKRINFARRIPRAFVVRNVSFVAVFGIGDTALPFLAVFAQAVFIEMMRYGKFGYFGYSVIIVRAFYRNFNFITKPGIDDFVAGIVFILNGFKFPKLIFIEVFAVSIFNRSESRGCGCRHRLIGTFNSFRHYNFKRVRRFLHFKRFRFFRRGITGSCRHARFHVISSYVVIFKLIPRLVFAVFFFRKRNCGFAVFRRCRKHRRFAVHDIKRRNRIGKHSSEFRVYHDVARNRA